MSLPWSRLDPERLTPVQKAICHEMFHRGDLRFLLHPGQQKVWEQIASDDKNDTHVICVSRQWGKGLALDTPIATPTGFTAMGELKVGDAVFDRDGQICFVEVVSPIHHIKCYEVEFNSGAVIVCDKDHLWLTQSTNEHKNGTESVKGIEAIRDTLIQHDQFNHRVSVCKSLNLSIELSIDPIPKHHYQGNRFIVDVRQIPSVPTRCIQVSSPSRTYLVGRELIPTHNSHMAVCRAISLAIQQPFAKIRYGAPTKEMVEKIVLPKFSEIMQFCPFPIRHVADTWTFPNQSQVIIVGTNINNGHRLRGVASDLVILDECREMPHLKLLIDDIIEPQFSTTDGQLWLLSTPPDSPSHDFTSHYIERAIATNSFYHATYRDSPLMTEKRLNKLLDKEGISEDSDGFRREYLADYTVADRDRKVIKSYKDDDEFFLSWCPPTMMRCFICMDLGSKDFTAILFGCYDWNLGKLVILDEALLTNPTTNDIAKAIKEHRSILIGIEATEQGAINETRIYSDTDLRLFADLKKDYGLQINPVSKVDVDAQINRLNVNFEKEKIKIHPRCKNLIFQLKTGVWNQRHTDYERSLKSGHLDALDALRYLNVLVNWHETFAPRQGLQANEIRTRPYVDPQRPFQGIMDSMRR